MQRIGEYFFNFSVMSKYFPQMMQGFWLTLQMAVLVVIFGILIGLFLAYIRSFGIRPLNWLLILFVDAMRSVPPLVIIMVIYFALPYAEVRFSSFSSTVIGLVLVLGAFAEEIFWAGIISVHKGQWEASRSTGLTFTQTLLHVILPQAIRFGIPPLTNRTIAITKGTALGSVVAAQEILNMAASAQSLSANPSPLILGAFLYLVIFSPLVLLSRYVERRFGWLQ